MYVGCIKSTVRHSEPPSNSFMFHNLRPHPGLLYLTVLRIYLEFTGFGKKTWPLHVQTEGCTYEVIKHLPICAPLTGIRDHTLVKCKKTAGAAALSVNF